MPENPLLLLRRGKKLSSSSSSLRPPAPSTSSFSSLRPPARSSFQLPSSSLSRRGKMQHDTMMKIKHMKNERMPKQLMVDKSHEMMRDMKMMKHQKMPVRQRQGRRFSPSRVTENVVSAKRAGREIMSVKEWLRRG